VGFFSVEGGKGVQGGTFCCGGVGAGGYSQRITPTGIDFGLGIKNVCM